MDKGLHFFLSNTSLKFIRQQVFKNKREREQGRDQKSKFKDQKI